MTEPINDGGPAYPFGQTDFETGRLVNGWGSEGMSLRDAFAISALPMCMTAEVDVETAALMAYGMAEAMLRARHATQGAPDAT
ncbi:hypothetical protein [Alcaligenes faecalis]|uniref:hypothetical protein n=1 Tax=Alcaligenes faecalis TaxID=511 RepID=UPI001EF1512A|nr:hypothetical protein [Alcaligenes faecalis]ULH08541.1 hypothetical protein MF263_08860 [Alcaligenes faecalis]